MTIIIVTLAAAAAAAGWTESQDTLPVRHRPERNTLAVDAGHLRALEISSQYKYVGGQRFILGTAAVAEQHLFVVADSGRAVQRFFWIQLEELLPERAGSYNYDADSVVTVQDLQLRANIRTYAMPPTAGSDRARAFALLERHGYKGPEGATRVRLVYLPDPNARREVMIIHVENPLPNAGAAPSGSLARALAGLVLHSKQ